MNQLSKTKRQIWISMNFLSLVAIIVFYYASKYFAEPLVFLVGGAISAIVLIISFIKVYAQTGLWKMVHSGKHNLDERQMEVVMNALRYSYVIFAISVLILIYGFTLFVKGPIHVLVAGGFLYFAHILPAAIIGFRENEI